MQAILNFGLLLMVLVAVFAVFGAVLVEKNKLSLKTGPRFSRVAATLVMGAAYWITQHSKAFTDVAGWNLVALLGLLWVLAFYLVWGVLVYRLNKHPERLGDDHGSMLSMLYVDSEHPGSGDLSMKPADAASAPKDASNKKSWTD
jgi:hypothetical protein